MAAQKTVAGKSIDRNYWPFPALVVVSNLGPSGGPEIDSKRHGKGCAVGDLSFLTIADVCTELRIHRSTFYRWRSTGRGPASFKLPNGHRRIRREEWIKWLRKLENNDTEVDW